MADKKKLEPDVDLKKEDEFQALTKTQKTAIIMMVLGEEEAANVVGHVPPREVQH